MKDADLLRDGGVFVQTHRPLPTVGATVTLTVDIEGDGRFEAPAVVTFAQEAALDEPHPGFGARLGRVSDALARALRRIASEREPVVLRRR